MPNTANAYTPDRGELEVTISSADVTAIAAFTTAEDIDLSGVLRKLEETTPQTKEYSEVFVTATSNPIKTTSSKVNATVWTLTIVDDYSKGSAGEWGTDTLAALEIFQEFFDASRTITNIMITPAGASAGMIQTTLVNVDVQSIPHPMTDADANAPNELPITLVVESFTKAAHA
jgi:hypothetical protein